MVTRVSRCIATVGPGVAAPLRELHCRLLAVRQHAGDRLIDQPAKPQQDAGEISLRGAQCGRRLRLNGHFHILSWNIELKTPPALIGYSAAAVCGVGSLRTTTVVATL
nr:hypothetical protein BDOA9_0130460 [Bradyrhizobium sp. DOA9]